MGVNVRVPNENWRHEIMIWMSDTLTKHGWREVFDMEAFAGKIFVKMRPFREFEIYDEQEAAWFILRWL